MNEFGTAPSPTVARWVRFRRDVWGRLRALTIPTVAAVHGYAVGGGLEMVLLCDIAIAADDASFCLPETGLGMIPGVAGTQTASRRLGPGRALDLCITGRWIDAGGFSNRFGRRSRASGDATRAAGALARSLSRLPRERVAMAKLAVWNGLDLPLDEGLAMERRLARRLENLCSKIEHRRPYLPRRGRAAMEETEYREHRKFHQHPRVNRPRPENPGFWRLQAHLRRAQRTGRSLSSAFKTLGLKPRDVVAALDTNSDNYIAGYYAAAKAGLTWLPLNYRAKDAELEYMINTAGAKVLLVGDRYLDLVGGAPKLKTPKWWPSARHPGFPAPRT